ncbi:hypothetical protein GY45DRAFT_607609 [Cubamyces sp. BRFM 1775]|nr:hypothetical protein GY45DRAFT_607609 [Cubamyces sp. BRFM 1775]
MQAQVATPKAVRGHMGHARLQHSFGVCSPRRHCAGTYGRTAQRRPTLRRAPARIDTHEVHTAYIIRYAAPARNAPVHPQAPAEPVQTPCAPTPNAQRPESQSLWIAKD